VKSVLGAYQLHGVLRRSVRLTGPLSGSARQRSRWAVAASCNALVVACGVNGRRAEGGALRVGEPARRGESNGFLRLKARDFRVDWAGIPALA